MKIRIPLTGEEKEITEDKMTVLRESVLLGKFPRCPPDLLAQEKEWQAGWAKIVSPRRRTWKTLREWQAGKCSDCTENVHLTSGTRGWGEPSNRRRLPDGSVALCSCNSKRAILERLISIAPELDGCAYYDPSYVSPTDPRKTCTIFAREDWFWMNLRKTIMENPDLTMRVVADSDLVTMAKPKDFKRKRRDDDEWEDPESASGIDEVAEVVEVQHDLLIIRVGYHLGYTKVDEVHQAILRRATRRKATWLWHDDMNDWKPTTGLGRYMDNNPKIRGAL